MYVPETRELTYFVAEEQHFGRAARRLDVTLLERTSRSARLTTAGAALLTEGRRALAAVTAAGERTALVALGQLVADPAPGSKLTAI